MIKPVTVLVVSNHGDIVGGGEISLLTLLANLDRTQWAPIIVVPHYGEVAKRCRSLGLSARVIPLPTLRLPGPAMGRSIVALWRLSRETGARFLHANGSRAMFYAGLAGWLSRKPVLWHVRIADTDHLLDHFLVRLARFIIVNSRAVGRRFPWAPPVKLRCVYNGVDLSKFRPHSPPDHLRPSLGLPSNGPVVASVGRFVPFKGYQYLLQAAQLVHQVIPECHWVLVGDGELRGELEQGCRRLGMDKYVHFTGWREDVADILALCDLFVLPSLGEHFGRVLIEAMAMAKAVVATSAGGVPEIVLDRETGILVPPAQAEPLAQAVLSHLNDPQWSASLGAAGRRRAETQFSITRHVEAVEDLYREVIEGSKGLR
jgi:glycosyltransferase involved in cell wall biosynthesis